MCDKPDVVLCLYRKSQSEGLESEMQNTDGPTGKQNHWFPVSNGIFEHRKKIKDALWLFLRYIDRTTVEKEGGDGGKVGLVFRGAPIKDIRVASELHCTKRTVCTWRRRLQACGYIKATRTPNGYTIKVLKSKKWISKNAARLAEDLGKNSASLAAEVGNIVPADLPSASQTWKPATVKPGFGGA